MESPAALFTTSVLGSPVVRSILHARIRDGSHNDVVFVGDRSIGVKQVKDKGHLEHVATKSDFDAGIRTAKVFTIQADSGHADPFVAGEAESSSVDTSALPSHCLVLTLDSNDILFLYLRTVANGQHEFVCQTFPMPTFDRVLFQPGQYLAVDHRSRAFAVAANERELVVCAAKTAARIQHELTGGDPDWCPVSAQRPMQIEGVIQQMEFLIPPADDADLVVLLLLVAQNRKVKAIRIDWHYASDIHHAEIHEALPLDQLPSTPGLLIPLRNAGFMIANGNELKRFDEILSGSTRCRTISVAQKEPESPGESPRLPMWTNWCRPERGPGAADQLYLAREDGNIFHVYEHGSPGFFASSSNAGNMDCHIGTAFASVGGLDDPDILVAAGDMSSGCIKEIGPRFAPGGHSTMSRTDTMEMKLVESLPNWASATDMVVSELSGKSQREREGVFVTSGRQPFGAVTELRRGLEARLSLIIGLQDLGSFQNAWALPILGVGHVLFILSGPSGTSFLALEDEQISPELPASLDAQHETILAIFAGGKLLQVTRKTICATAGVDASFEDRVRSEKSDGDTILAAACDAHRGILVTAERRAQGEKRSALLSYKFCGNEDGRQANVVLELLSTNDQPDETLAIACVNKSSATAVFTSTVTGDLRAFLVGTDGRFGAAGEMHLPELEDGPSMCDSIVIIPPPDAGGTDRSRGVLIVCGLRDGRLCTVQATFADDKVAFGFEKSIHFGRSSVKVTQPTDITDSAYAMSGLDTCRLSWRGTDGAALEIESIWLIDKEQPDLVQGAITGCAHLPPAHILSSSAGTLADGVVFISGGELSIGTLDVRATTVPRQIEVSGTPSRALYLDQQRCMACASLQYEVRTFSTAPFIRRQIWPVIDFLQSKSGAETVSHQMQPGERVYALLGWSFKKDDDKVYSFLLVGGSYVSSKSHSTRGRITFLQPTYKSKKWDIVGVKEGRSMKFDDPVYALALLDDLTFVACSGFNVVVHRFDTEDTKWHPLCAPFQMHSPGTCVTVVRASDDTATGALITISTSKDSATVLRFEANSEQGEDSFGHKLTLHSTAPRADASLNHLTINNTTLLTTKNGKLIGLQTPPQSTHNTSSRILFEASLPRSLTRIRRANIRPRWKPAPPTGVLAPGIVACSADGALTGVMLLDETLWRRLSWLQRLCEWSEALSPHSWQTPVYSVSEETFARNERGMPIGFSGTGDEVVMKTERKREGDRHVDGDILVRVLERGGVECLRRLVRQAAERNDAVGVWVRNHLDEELEAAENMIKIVEIMVHGWL